MPIETRYLLLTTPIGTAATDLLVYIILNICIDSCVPSNRCEVVLSRYSYPDCSMPLTKSHIKLKVHFHRLYETINKKTFINIPV